MAASRAAPVWLFQCHGLPAGLSLLNTERANWNDSIAHNYVVV